MDFMRPLHAIVFAASVLLGAAAGPGCTRPQPTTTPPPAEAEPPAQACTKPDDCGLDRMCEAGVCRPCKPGECSSCPAIGGCLTADNCPPSHVCAPASTTHGQCNTCHPDELPPDEPPAVAIPGELNPADDPQIPEDPKNPAPPPATPKSLLLAMSDAYARVRDYTVTMTRRERVKGKLLPQEVMAIKFRKPFSIYTKWTGSVFNGREALYIRGKNGNKLRAHQGSFPDVTVDIDPKGGLAMKGNRHPITEGSLGDLIGLLTRDIQRAESRPQDGAIIKDLGESVRHGKTIRCFDATFAVADGYYAPHVQICMFTATNLPSRVQVWDAREQLLEDYEYRDLRTNVGLRDFDFDSSNPKYNF